MPTLDEIVERLRSGEAPEEVLLSLRPAAHHAALKVCATVRSFDRGLFDTLLAPAAGPDAPAFDELVQLPEVEPVPRATDTYRLSRSARSTHWNAWWRDESDRPETELPAALRALVTRLVEHFRRITRDPAGLRRGADRIRLEEVELLFHLAVSDPRGALRLFTDLYRVADEQCDLAMCHDLIEVLRDGDRTTLLGRELTAARNDRAAYLAARSLWSTEYLQTGTFLEPDGARATYERLIGPGEPDVLYMHAPGGSGKTMELRWLIARQLVRERPDATGPFGAGRIPCAKIDFDVVDPVNATSTPWLVLLEVADQLNQQMPLAPFTEFLQEYGWAMPLLRRRVVDHEKVADASRRLTAQQVRLEATVPRTFARCLIEAQTATVLLAFDTVEEVHLRPHGDLQALLRMLTRLLRDCPGLRLILSGRYEIRTIVGDAAAELPVTADREPQPFSPQGAQDYLERLRGIDRPEVRDAIVAKVGGDPFKLALLADIAQQDPRISPAEIERYEADLIYLVQRIIKRIAEPGVRWLLRYGVVPRTLTVRFVHDVLEPFLRDAMAGRGRWDSPGDDELPAEVAGGAAAFPTDLLPTSDAPLDLVDLWNRLLRFAAETAWVTVVPDEPDTLRFHPAILEPMRRVLAAQDVDGQLHKNAAAYFTELARAPGGERWLCEAVYHHFQHHGQRAASFWHEALDTVEIGEPERREVLAAELFGPDYLVGGVPRAWRDGSPIMAPKTVLEAHFERASALAQIARKTRASRNDQLWSDTIKNLAAVDHLQRESARQVVPEWRLAYVRAALALKDGQHDAAERYLLDALRAGAARPVADQRQDVVRLRLLLAEAQLARGDRAALATYRSAVGAARRIPSAARWEPQLRGRVVAAYAELDRLREVDRELRTVLELGCSDDELCTSLHLIGADAALRSGRVTAAGEHAARALERAVDPGPASEAAARVALVDADPRRALELADEDAPGAAGASAATAARLELAGVAAGDLMEFDRAVGLLERARGRWFDSGDLEAVARCYTISAMVQLRGVGNLTVAEHHLHEAEALELPVGCDGWLKRAAARAELLQRQGHASAAAAQATSTLEELRGRWTPPRRLVRAMVNALAVGAPERRGELLDLVVERLRAVSPASARVVLLAGLAHVAGPDDLSAGRMRAIRGLLRVPPQQGMPARDRAMLMLHIAEVDRLCGWPTAAVRALVQARDLIRGHGAGFVRRRWWQAVDRLGTAGGSVVVPSSDGSGFLQEFRDFPLLCAAFLIERAEASAAAGARDVAGEQLSRAVTYLEQTRDQATQWHARRQKLEGELARGQTVPDAVWIASLSAAGAAFDALGDAAGAAVTPGEIRDDALVGLERSRARVRLALDDRELMVSSGTGDVAAHSLDHSFIGGLFGDRSDPTGGERFSYELARRFCSDWLGTARQLGDLLLPGAGPRSAIGLRLEIEDGRLAAVPWELAVDRRSDRLLTDEHHVVYRAVSKAAAARDEVRFVQSGLNIVQGGGLVVDGDIGPQTRDTLCRYQRERGLVADEIVRPDVVDSLQADIARAARRPLVVVVQPSSARQVAGTRGAASTGVHLARLYQRHGFDVQLVEDPTPDTLSNAVRTAGPAVVHLCGSLRESSGGVGFTFLAGEWDPSAWDLSVTSLHRLLKPVSTAPVRVVVVLDVDHPKTITDAVSRMLLRNTYAAEVFALGGCAAVLATGFAGEDSYELYGPLVGSLGSGRSLGATTAAIRRSLLLPEPDLGRVLPLAGVALFTHLPWLRVAATKGGPDADR